MDYEPPLPDAYKKLLESSLSLETRTTTCEDYGKPLSMMKMSVCELPVIDLDRLNNTDHVKREECMKDIIEAAKHWGFFQVVNHGISQQFLQNLLLEQKKMFHRPFAQKSQETSRSFIYKWGNPFATNLSQLSWSEAFHILPNDEPAHMVEDHHKCLR